MKGVCPLKIIGNEAKGGGGDLRSVNESKFNNCESDSVI